MNKRRKHERAVGSAALWEIAGPILQLPHDHLLRAAVLDFLLDPRLTSFQVFVMARNEGRGYLGRDEADRIAQAARGLAAARRHTGLATITHFFATTYRGMEVGSWESA